MKKTIVIMLLSFIIKGSYSQNDSKRKVNFIIMIDGKIPFQGDMNLNFLIVKENKKTDTIGISYVPGDVYLPESDFNKILQSKDVKSIVLEIRFTELCKEVKSYTYKVEFYKTWLSLDFTILRIYNLDKKKNKEIFFPLKGEEYTYEIDSPNGSITRVKKKNYKVRCD